MTTSRRYPWSGKTCTLCGADKIWRGGGLSEFFLRVCRACDLTPAPTTLTPGDPQ